MFKIAKETFGKYTYVTLFKIWLKIYSSVKIHWQ
jgi:hypothetical protein